MGNLQEVGKAEGERLGQDKRGIKTGKNCS
jgi:hypothetical protein